MNEQNQPVLFLMHKLEHRLSTSAKTQNTLIFYSEKTIALEDRLLYFQYNVGIVTYITFYRPMHKHYTKIFLFLEQYINKHFTPYYVEMFNYI